MTNEEFDGGPLSPPTPEEICERYRAGYEELAESIRILNEKAEGLGYEGIWSAMHALSELRAGADMAPEASKEWMQDSGLLYRLKDGVNYYEVSVTMAAGSRDLDVRAAFAGSLGALLAAAQELAK